MGWKSSSVLEVRLKDECNKPIYKSKVNVADVKKLSLVLSSLESLGVKIIEAVGRMINNEKEDVGWFG